MRTHVRNISTDWGYLLRNSRSKGAGEQIQRSSVRASLFSFIVKSSPSSFNTYRDGKIETASLSHPRKSQGWIRLKLRARNSILIFHISVFGPSPAAFPSV